MTLPGIQTLYQKKGSKVVFPWINPQINLQWHKEVFNELDFHLGSSKEGPVLISFPNSR